MDENEKTVLCAANAYEQKYYFNRMFDKLPEAVKKELNIICVLFTEEIGGVFSIVYTPEGEVLIETNAASDDFSYDEIGSRLMVREVQMQRRELFSQLEMFYKCVVLGDAANF